ncbi:hypothetical protein Scinn_35320 [Streptomyces virginiae]|uniref:Uncharacterized protein n=1 Tax=Streptomyces virginiae TaxID=1961 RepID=A0ABQ3NMR9_STRVG|nr:hypothetical protein Scinn_35320 [Streptomyces virginiae]
MSVHVVQSAYTAYAPHPMDTTHSTVSAMARPTAERSRTPVTTGTAFRGGTDGSGGAADMLKNPQRAKDGKGHAKRAGQAGT